MIFVVGDYVWWWQTSNILRRGTVKEVSTTSIGVLPDDGRKIIPLPAAILTHVDAGVSS